MTNNLKDLYYSKNVSKLYIAPKNVYSSGWFGASLIVPDSGFSCCFCHCCLLPVVTVQFDLIVLIVYADM